MMDYPCGKFCDCSISRFGFIMQTNRQTNRHTERESSHTDAAKRFTPATVVGVSNSSCKWCLHSIICRVPSVLTSVLCEMSETWQMPLSIEHSQVARPPGYRYLAYKTPTARHTQTRWHIVIQYSSRGQRGGGVSWIHPITNDDLSNVNRHAPSKQRHSRMNE